MSLPDLAAILWRQRELLERLVYRLECEQLLLAAGRSRWLGMATAEVETLLEELRVLELQRAAVADRVCAELGLPAGASLEELAGTTQPPWTGVLLDHRQALIALTTELAALAEANRHLMATGLKTVESALASLGLRPPPSALGYDARGRSDVLSAPSQTAVDRTL